MEVMALVDSGADVSCISESALPIGAVRTKAKFQLRTATGSEMSKTPNGHETVLGLSIGGLVCPDIAPYIFENLSCPVILGIDWLRSAKALIQLSNNRRVESISVVGSNTKGVVERMTIHSEGVRQKERLASIAAIGKASPTN